jgi:hypothetical protein
MLPNVNKTGESFIKLIKARNSDLAEDIKDYDGEDTCLLDHYIETEETSKQLGIVTIIHVPTVSLIGNPARAYDNEVMAYKDANNDIWMDAEMHDEIFC